MVRRQTVFNHNVFLKTSRLNFILEKSNIAKSLLTLSNTNNKVKNNQQFITFLLRRFAF